MRLIKIWHCGMKTLWYRDLGLARLLDQVVILPFHHYVKINLTSDTFHEQVEHNACNTLLRFESKGVCWHVVLRDILRWGRVVWSDSELCCLVACLWVGLTNWTLQLEKHHMRELKWMRYLQFSPWIDLSKPSQAYKWVTVGSVSRWISLLSEDLYKELTITSQKN